MSLQKKVNDISYDIDLIIKNNKEKLKQELNEIDQKVENNQLTKAEADKLRFRCSDRNIQHFCNFLMFVSFNHTQYKNISTTFRQIVN